MLRKSKKQPQTVAEKVSKLLAHPNESDSAEDSDFDVATWPRLVDFEEEEYDLPDARSTDFRKTNVKLLSEQSDRYKGKISSRKELDEDDDEQELSYEESDEDEDDEDLTDFKQKLKAGGAEDSEEETAAGHSESGEESEEIESNSTDFQKKFEAGDFKYDDYDEEEDDDSEEEDQESEGDDDDDDNDSEDEEAEDDAIKPSDVMSKTNHQAEIQKGLAVQNQLRIWERLLELRINTQKFTSKANQLPAPDSLTKLASESDELQSVLTEAQERSSKLLQQLLSLQSALHQQNSEMKKSVKRKQPGDDSGPAVKSFGSVLQSNFQQMTGYRNEVLLKWDDRTKLLTPGAGVKRKSLQEDYDIIKKIDSALANREALVEKSQTPKNNQAEQKENSPVQRLKHIYDDSDFYHQQLRELIEYKASTSSNMSEITKQFVELQKLRQKMKKKVDTRASKGRKLRYVVHNKLINFMAPNESSDWTEASKSELYKSLFV
ncbi:protein Aatf [Drosophila sechellia]|uniref:GM16208 n=1 Tax=Drosophila sechellia TaxID=7238 RepID=B4HXW7_DROSE|nr:protein Aatf [Drosophila sechellia]EDW51897.1 GM16208 [Drosophila sechellia]